MFTSGMKSSEFWVTIIGAVALPFIPDFPVESVAVLVAYVISRGLAKWQGQ